MKIPALLVPAVLAIAFFAACQEETRPRERQNAANRGGNQFGYGATEGTATDFIDSAPTPTPTPSVVTTTGDPSLPPSPSPTPAITVATTERDLQYGTPVPGKAGFVTSPHAPYAGYVDVRGFAPGMEVKDPYSGKIFLVP